MNTTKPGVMAVMDVSLSHISNALEDCESGRPAFAVTQLQEAMHYAREARATVERLAEALQYATCGEACQHNRCAIARAALAEFNGTQP